MTTAAVLLPPLPPSIIRPALPLTGQSATLAIPLAEFGKSLADADLDRWFEDFAERNSDSGHTYAIASTGVLLIMPPTGYPGTVHEMKIATVLDIWTDEHGGVAFPATARFVLPDGSRFGPDAAWVREERREELMAEHNRPFPHIVPDFIVEVQSPSNSRAELVAKINRFIAYGTRLAWLMDAGDPGGRQVPTGAGAGGLVRPGVCGRGRRCAARLSFCRAGKDFRLFHQSTVR